MLANKLEGAAAAVQPAFIEDCFSSYLYTGTGSSQTITNGIDLAGDGGLVWIKGRSGATGHRFTDTARGATKSLESNSTAAEATESTGLTAFGSTGFTIGADADYNTSSATYVSWTFRKQAKFFDVVTYTGNGSNRTISHNLGSVPGCIIVKRTDTSGDWQVYHRSIGNTKYLVLNSTAAEATSSTRWNDTTPTSTVFSVGTESTVNANGGTYVAYLFAHDAGGFGATGSDNVISCGSYVGNGSTTSAGAVNVNLGWEPQYVLVKSATATQGDANWNILDTQRGWTTTGGVGNNQLRANLSNAEQTNNNFYGEVTATGFRMWETNVSNNGTTYIYIAIRRGPMKTPESGSEVFSLDASSAGSSGGLLGAISASDLVINSQRDPAYNSPFVFIDRLRGVGQVNTGNTTKALYSSSTNAETSVDTTSTSSTADGVNGAYLYSTAGKNSAIRTVQQGSGGSVAYNLRRAPGFFDVVAYTGDGASTRSMNHNLTVAPELLIAQNRTGGGIWFTYLPSGNIRLALNYNFASPVYGGAFAGTTPTATTFSFDVDLNTSGQNYIAYLFASVPGVSKVGSYTGTGTTKQIDCGFTGGARFVLIKRTDSTGDWYVWDTARGIVSGDDPYLLLNSTAAEVTNTDYIDTYSAGFEISSTAPAAINANGGTFIFLAIA
jgi:hypothetical protein